MKVFSDCQMYSLRVLEFYNEKTKQKRFLLCRSVFVRTKRRSAKGKGRVQEREAIMRLRKMWKKLVSAALTTTLVVGLVGCGNSSSGGKKLGKDGGKLIIGGTYTLSGECAHAGQNTLKGAKAAVEYINNNGGVNGQKVELKYYDDEFDESKIPTLYEKLISDDKVDLLTSPYTSPFLAAAPIAAKHNKEMFCVAADSYTANEQYQKLIANPQMDESWKGGGWWKDVFEYLNENYDKYETSGKKTVAILNLETTYGHEVSDAVGKFLKKNGFNVVYEEFFDPGNSDWTATVQKVKNLKPDVLFAPQYFEDSVSLVQKCKEMDCYAPIMIIEGMSWDPISWPNTELGGLEPSTAKLPFLGYSIYKEKYDSKSKEFLADYCKKEFNSIPSNDVICGFMAVELACEAARKANSTETEDLQKAMTENTFNLAGYPYKMNETGGNGADFDWGCGQFQPKDLSKADESGDDWVTLWPEKYATSSEALTFKGWK